MISGGVMITGGGRGIRGLPPGPPGLGPTGPSPGKSSGFGIAATSAGALALFASLELISPSPRLGSYLARTAWTWASASGAAAIAHWEIKRICSGAATIADSTIAATNSTEAADPSIEALTISQEHSGAAATSLETTSRTLPGSASTDAFTERASFWQSTSAEKAPPPSTTAKKAGKKVFFMTVGCGMENECNGAGSGNRTRVSSLEG